MKKKIILIVSLVLSFAIFTSCGKKETGDQPALIMATEPGFAPYEYMEGDKVVGIDIDISNAISKALGRKLEIKIMDFDGALEAVSSGKVDFVAAGVSVNDERKQTMDFTVEYVDTDIVVVVNKEDPALSKVEDLDGKKVGVQMGNTADFHVEDEYEAEEIKRYSRFAQAAEDLKNRKIDCIVMDKFPAEELVAVNEDLIVLDGVLFSDKYAIAVQKGNTEMLEKLNKVIKDLIETGKIEEFTENHTIKK